MVIRFAVEIMSNLDSVENGTASLSISESESYEEVVARHKKEKKELAAKSIALKKAHPPKDKKKRKEVLAQIEALEVELEKRQADELKQVEDQRQIATDPSHQNGDNADPQVEGEKDVIRTDSGLTYRVTKESKKAAKKRRQMEKQKELLQAAYAEARSQPDLQKEEHQAIQKQLDAEGLEMKEVRKCGCLWIHTWDGEKLMSVRSDPTGIACSVLWLS